MNPSDCKTAKYLLCEWPTMVWGLGSVTHHILYCLSIAVLTKRVLLIDAKNFYPRKWSSYFLEPSDKCWNHTRESYIDWYELDDIETSDEQVVRLFYNTTKNFNRTRDYPDMMPYSFIKNMTLYKQIQGHHKQPELWVVSQLVKYLYELNSNFKKRLQKTKEWIGYKHPIVGVHIRRGDKIREAPPVPTHTYMEHVARYYEHTPNAEHESLVYLASDDANVYNETTNEYKAYRFVYIDPSTTGRKLDRAVADLFLLADSDFFVGTFSSSFGRLIHELRQQKYEDGVCMGVSLDRGYHYNSCCDIGYKLTDIHINCSYDNITIEKTLKQLF
ncbi:unnamed protein product [Owenia fusiformis]|uniref:GT23 domain-containing protein n=1 Tax=Owenia fusiformis TaxID=6347 RepID=A0A8S4QAZ6_OWEFU|nr:unnamed protein product [Owenia fusiformis]